MEDQLKAIIEKIKLDGIKNANSKTEEILAEAKAKAEAIIQKAEKDKEEIINNAKNEALKFEQSGKQAVEQAGRDIILKVEKRLTALFEESVKSGLKKSFDKDIVKSGLTALLKNWKKDEYKELNALLPEKMINDLEGEFKKELAEELASGVEIKISPNLKEGFRISQKNGEYYYDFSSAGIGELLAEYLTPRFAECVLRAAGKE